MYSAYPRSPHGLSYICLGVYRPPGHFDQLRSYVSPRNCRCGSADIIGPAVIGALRHPDSWCHIYI
jgi:hypothetical protein